MHFVQQVARYLVVPGGHVYAAIAVLAVASLVAACFDDVLPCPVHPQPVLRLAYLRLPASSNTGRYSNTTIAPISTPMSIISNGSNRRVAMSTQRVRSSS